MQDQEMVENIISNMTKLKLAIFDKLKEKDTEIEKLKKSISKFNMIK